jgi:hypothetical protein
MVSPELLALLTLPMANGFSRTSSLALLTLPVANGFSRTSSLTHIAYGEWFLQNF